MDLSLTRPSDDGFTRRIRSIRCPWTRAVEGRNVLTGDPLPVAPVEQVVAFMNGEEPAPSKNRPAGMARPMPPAVRPTRRRGFVRRFADRLGWTIDLYRQRVHRRLVEGRVSWRSA